MTGIISPRKEGIKVGGIYISGPMRGYEDLNFPAFYQAEHDLKEMGVTVPMFNPARADDEQNLHGLPFRELIVIDLKEMFDNRQGAIMLPGWEKSEGADFEFIAAKLMGTPVITLELALSNGPEFVNNLFGENYV